jgi:DNA mismatch repair protein MutS
MTKADKLYLELKQGRPNRLILIRRNDFYECREDDARIVSNVLGITLSRYTTGLKHSFCCFPFYALDTYLPKLIRAGYKVAICNQLDEPQKPVKRGITELVSPNPPK